MDKLPPHAVDAEKGILGCILLSPQESLTECAESGISHEMFYVNIHAELYQIFADLGQFDLVSMTEKLKSLGRLDAIGGVVFLSSLMDCAPSAASLSYYIPIVKEKAKLRTLLRVSTEAQLGVYTAENSEQLLDQVERDILSIRDDKGDRETKSARELVVEASHTIERYLERRGEIDGLSTGLPDLDKLTWGLHPAEVVVVAARPSCGKTSLVTQIVDHVAVNLKQPVAFFSLETVADKLILRMKCSRAKVDRNKLRRGEVSEDECKRLVTAGIQISKAPLYIRDKTGIGIGYMKAAARRMWQQYGIKLFAIDYLQLMSSQTKRGENREREVAQISNGIKSIANDLKVAVLVISAINRECENENRRPRLTDLRESGQLEFDADQAWLLYRPAAQQGQVNDPSDIEHQVNLDVAKNKEGELGTVKLWFKKQYTRFESMSRVQE